MEEINLKTYPSTRYQGSKRKLLPWIYKHVKCLQFESCLDAFGGTGSVSYLFKKMGKQVTYNDILKFNYYTGLALIENKNIKLSPEDITKIKGESSNDNLITQNFKNIFYFNRENKWLDKIACNIIRMNHYEDGILKYKRALAYYSLFQSSLIKRPFNLFHRKNLSLRKSDVDRNFGNKTTWDKTFTNHFNTFAKEINKLVFDSGKNCFAQNKSVFDIQGSYDLVYLDPPYINKKNSNETADYLRCYHFLEGLANYHDWLNLIDHNTINLRFKTNDLLHPFHIDNIYNTYDLLFKKFENSIIVLSYKNGGIPSINFLVSLLKKYKTKVFTHSIQYSYALNRQNGDAGKNREVLIIGINHRS